MKALKVINNQDNSEDFVEINEIKQFFNGDFESFHLSCESPNNSDECLRLDININFFRFNDRLFEIIKSNEFDGSNLNERKVVKNLPIKQIEQFVIQNDFINCIEIF